MAIRLREVLSFRHLARVLSGCIVYYTGIAAYHLVSRDTYSQKAGVGLTLLVPTAFACLTAMWSMFDARETYRTSLWISLLIGPILFLPIYVLLIEYNRLALTAVERLGAVIGGYLILPVLILAIQQTPMGRALDLSLLSALLVCFTFGRARDTRIIR